MVLDDEYIPEIKPQPITEANYKTMILEHELYNKDCRLFKAFTEDGEEIPLKYRGANRYWKTEGVMLDPVIGEHTLYFIYELDPEEPGGRVLLAVYYITNEAGEKLQDMSQIQKHTKAARMEAERQERMSRKYPELVSKIDTKLPQLMTPVEGKDKLANLYKSDKDNVAGSKRGGT